MLAPKVAPAEREVVTNHWAGEEPEPVSAVPRIGRVKGSARRFTLRHMRPKTAEVASPAAAASKGFASNHPVCPNCGGPARPAILMFSDFDWLDYEPQEDRFSAWCQQVSDLARQRLESGSRLRVALLEVGAGGNVPTVRRTSESALKDFLEAGADASLLRVNPDDFPLADQSSLEGNVISMMGRGLHSLQLVDAFMGPASLSLAKRIPPPMPPPPPPPPISP
ncbi:unnamed protein product [Effrenium voratum]|nr:unnamed protein product [Effrenium voratum]